MSRFGMLIGSDAVPIRTPPAFMDIYTIVSIFPKEIAEINPTLSPGDFKIGPGTLEKPAVLVLGSSVSWNRYSADMPPAEMTFSAIQVAESFIKDRCHSMVGVKVGTHEPGIFYVEGRKTSKEVLEQFPERVSAADKKQRNWYALLVQAADSLWARSNGNPVAIPLDSRLAAEALNMKNKPWMQDFNTLQMVACANCGGLRNPNFPSCMHCKMVVDQALFKKLGLSAPEGIK